MSSFTSEKPNIKKKWYFHLLVLVLILPVLAALLRSPIRMELISANTMKPSDNVDIETKDNLYTFSSSEAVDEIVLCMEDKLELPPGAYRVRICYEAIPNDPAVASENIASLNLRTYEYHQYFRFDELKLRSDLKQMEQTVCVTNPWFAVDDIDVFVSFGGEGSLRVSSIEITEILAYNCIRLIAAIGLIVFAVILFKRLRYGSLSQKKAWGGVALITLFACLPFFSDMVTIGDDALFHVNRIVCLAEELRMGRLFSPLYTTALNGYGYAAPIFYGQVFLYLPAFLYSCGFDLGVCCNVFFCCINLATALTAFTAAKRIFRKDNLALLASALYTLSIPRLTNMLSRFALGELTAQTFIPLVILGFFRIITYEPRENALNKRIPLCLGYPLVAGLTGIMLSHTLSVYMCGILCAVFCLIYLRKVFQKPRLLMLAKTALLTLVVNLSTIVPFIDGYRMPLKIKGGINYIQGHGAYPLQIFTPHAVGNARGSVLRGYGNEMSMALGFSLVIGLLAYTIYLVMRKKKPSKPDERMLSGFAGACFAMTVIALFLACVFMPYDALLKLPYTLYSYLTVFQFPWRWLVWAAAFAVFVGVYAVSALDEVFPAKKAPQICAAAMALFVVLNVGQIYGDQLKQSNAKTLINNSYEYSSLVMNGEYLLQGVDEERLLIRDLTYGGSVEQASLTESKNGTSIIHVLNGESGDGYAELPLLCYDHYHAYAETGSELPIEPGESFRVRVSIPSGYEGSVRVVYETPVYCTAAALVSAAAVLWLCLKPLIKRKWRGGIPA